MRFCLFIFFSVLFSVYGQQKTVEINWENSSSLKIVNSNINIQGASSMFSDGSSLGLDFISSWKASSVSYVGSRAVNISSAPVSKVLFNSIDINKLPSRLDVSVETKTDRGERFEVLRFNPLMLKNGKVYRVASFNLIPSSRGLSARDPNVPSRSSSVLATGEWRRFSTDTSGVYKITPQFLESIGVNLSGVNPNTIKIYGTGGKSLPLINEENRFFDIPEVPVKLIDVDNNGVFSGNDYLLFYAIGNRGYQAQNDSTINPYSDETFYYVTTGGVNQKEVVGMQEPLGNATTIFNSYNYETFFEEDLTNIGALGRKWFGDKFDGNVLRRSYNLSIPNPVVNSEISFLFPFAGVYRTIPTLNVRISAGDEFNQNISFNSFSSGSFVYGVLGSTVARVRASPDVSLSFELNQNGDPSAVAYLDYIRAFAECQLRGFGRQFIFSNLQQRSATGISEFRISNANNISSVWNITDPFSISEKQNISRENIFTIKVSSGRQEEFIAIDESDFFNPIRVANSGVANQDLKGNIFRNASQSNQQGELDYLIITNSDFVGAANRLANFRKQQNGFDIKVVTVDQIYNEFSTGQQDITAIRNFVKYIYDNARNPADRLKYVCVIGDCSYDYKERIENNTNIVPAYYAINSRSQTRSYFSDDFYGGMDATEGSNISRDLLDIALGRIVAPTPEVANQMVDKIIRYYDEQSFGTWRNRFLFVCDDVDNSNNGIDATLSLVLDRVAEDLKIKLPNANVKKLFADAFRQEVSPAGDRYPVVKSSLINSFQSGAAYINYFGHGGEDGITSEAIFRANDARALTNADRLTVFTTLTCELTRFDNPLRDTAGEFLFWNRSGGAVALLTTTRNLSFTTALGLNPILAEALFDENQNAIPIGEALRVAKNNLISFGDNRLAVYCVGDPALEIAFPKPRVELTRVNNIPMADFEGSLRALDRVKVEGRVVEASSNMLIESFEGSVGIVVFDKIQQRNTLANDGTVTCWDVGENSGFVRVNRCSDDELFVLNFQDSGEAVFNGQASVKSGLFSMEFVLSKNIRLPLGEGKLSFYARNSQAKIDQNGSSKIMVGGLNTEVEEDIEPPLISMFLNNEDFVDGQLVNSNPTLIAVLSDSNGINTAGGVGHDILATIDNDEKNTINLNDFYSTNLDDFTTGRVNFRLNDLSIGEHVLKLRVSDVFNNVSTQEISFRIGEAEQFEIAQVLNYPNPFTSYTEFWFNHTGSPVDVLEVTVQILTVSGKIVTTKFATLSGNTNSYRGGIDWDARDDFGNKVGKGVYIYNITVKSTLTDKTFSKFEKLVIL